MPLANAQYLPQCARQCFGSGTDWIRIQITTLDPDPYSESRSRKWNWAKKNPLFPQIFYDFHLFLRMIPNRSSMFTKKPTWLVENKNKIPTFYVDNKNFSQHFFFALEKLVFCCLDPDPGSGSGIRNPDPDWGKSPGSWSVKNESGSETLAPAKR